MDPVEQQTPPPRRLKWVLGFGLIGLGLAGLAVWAFASPGAMSYYATPAEVHAQGLGRDGSLVRLGGRVATLERDGASVAFTVTDGTAEVPVVFRGEIPDTLKAETDVIAEGTLAADGTLRANRVLAKCSSKFVPEEDRPEHLGRTTAKG